MLSATIVIPLKNGIHLLSQTHVNWIPAFAGMTRVGWFIRHLKHPSLVRQAQDEAGLVSYCS